MRSRLVCQEKATIKYLIINADDFGYSRGINRGIAEAHSNGVLTATGLMVNTPATDEAVRMSRDLPDLSIGLHVNFTNEADRLVEFNDPAVCRTELRRQFDRFVGLMGRLPTHLDSHQHVHRDSRRAPWFIALAEQHGLPLRDYGPTNYIGGFYGQWEYGVSDPAHVSVDALEVILQKEVGHGITELGCHPGYFDASLDCVYHHDREFELRTLCDPRSRELIDELGIRLIGFRELPDAVATLSGGVRHDNGRTQSGSERQ